MANEEKMTKQEAVNKAIALLDEADIILEEATVAREKAFIHWSKVRAALDTAVLLPDDGSMKPKKREVKR